MAMWITHLLYQEQHSLKVLLQILSWDVCVIKYVFLKVIFYIYQ